MFFFSPYFSTEEKKDGPGQGGRRTPTTRVVNFLELLVENHRMPVIFRIRREYDVLWEEENQLLPVEVTSAVELDPRWPSASATDRRADRPHASS